MVIYYHLIGTINQASLVDPIIEGTVQPSVSGKSQVQLQLYLI